MLPQWVYMGGTGRRSIDRDSVCEGYVLMQLIGDWDSWSAAPLAPQGVCDATHSQDIPSVEHHTSASVRTPSKPPIK